MAATSDIKAGGAVVEIGARDKTAAGLAAAKAKLDSWAGSVAKIGAGFSAMGASLTAPFLAALPAWAEAGKDLDLVAQRSGLTVGMLSSLKFALTDTGADMATLETGSRKLATNLADAAGGSDQARAKFRSLGLSWEELQKASPDARLEAIAEALGKLSAEDASVAAVEMLGKSGAQLLPVLRNMRQVREEAESFGEVKNEEQVGQAVKLAEAYDKLERVVKSIPKFLAGLVAKDVTDFTEAIAGAAVGAKKWLKEHKDLLMTAFKIGTAMTVAGGTVLGFAAVIKTSAIGIGVVIKVIAGIKAAIAGLTAIGGIVSGALGVAGTGVTGLLVGIATPLAAIAAAVAAGVAIWYVWGDSIKAAVSAVIAWLKPITDLFGKTFAGIKAALKQGDIGGAMKIAWAGLKAIGAQAIRQFSTAIVSGFHAAFAAARSAVSSAWGKVKSVLTGISDWFMSGPLGSGISYLGGLLSQLWGWFANTSAGSALADSFGWVSDAVTGLVDAFAPVIGTVKDTLGGIVEALTAGDLSAAATIAFTGLKLAAAQALDGLTGLLDSALGPFGETLRNLGSDLLQGDFSTALMDLSTLWTQVWEGMVGMVSSAVEKVGKMWADMVQGISNWLLESSAGGGVMGAVASKILGVDMAKEEGKRKILEFKTQEKDRQLAAQSIPQIEETLRQARESGDQDKIAANERFLEEQKAKAAGTYQYKQGPSALDQAKDSVNADMEQRKSALKDFLDAAKQAAADRTQESKDRAAEARDKAGTMGLGPLIAKLQEDLTTARANLKPGEVPELLADDLEQLINDVANKEPGKKDGATTPPGESELASQVQFAKTEFGTFSASAASAQFGAGGGTGKDKVQHDQLREQKEIRRHTERQADAAEAMLKKPGMAFA